MKPFAVFKGTNDDDGKFIKLKHPGKKRLRYRIDLWVQTVNGDRLTNEITTKEPCRLNDLMEQTVTPAVEEIIAEARDLGGTAQYGFNCYQWG